MSAWSDIARLDKDHSFLERVCWPYDKYPDMPELKAGAQIVLLDADGPGVVVNIHSSRMDVWDEAAQAYRPASARAYGAVMIDVFYDGRSRPDISVPLVAFLADPDGQCAVYSSLYFSKVRFSHNFRLPIPFSRHIRIILRNTGAEDLISYTDLQWKRLAALPEDTGYLRLCYNSGSVRIPEQTVALCDIAGAGTLRAHWLSLGCAHPLAREGEYVCEGNQEFYIDGESVPSLEYLGTEDLYGHSWGLSGIGGDGYAAIIRMEHPAPGRTQIAMLRCRTDDAVGFRSSLRVILDYTHEYFSPSSRNPLHAQRAFACRERARMEMDIQACFYYYGPIA